MNTVAGKLIVSGILFLSTVISGVTLSYMGRPINGLMFNVHKLIAVATAILIAMALKQLYQAQEAGIFIEAGVIAITAALFLALVVTGALLSRDIQLPAAVLRIHQVAPPLLFVFSSITIFLFANRNALPIK